MECIMLSGQENTGSGNNLRNSRKGLFIFAGTLIVILILVTGGYSAWKRYFSKEAKDVAAFKNYQKNVEEAYQNDTYGGATPEETLRLFVEALKKEDVELASKYFALDDNLSREKWVSRLSNIKSKGFLKQMIQDLERAVSDPEGSLYKNDSGFIIYTADGVVGAEVDMELNPISKVWKIESL